VTPDARAGECAIDCPDTCSRDAIVGDGVTVKLRPRIDEFVRTVI
jgi:hypothetical protein